MKDTRKEKSKAVISANDKLMMLIQFQVVIYFTASSIIQAYFIEISVCSACVQSVQRFTRQVTWDQIYLVHYQKVCIARCVFSEIQNQAYIYNGSFLVSKLGLTLINIKYSVTENLGIVLGLGPIGSYINIVHIYLSFNHTLNGFNLSQEIMYC